MRARSVARYPFGVVDSLTASMLVAMPQLDDPNFRRSVVLLVHHDEEGSFGLVVNRPADVSVGDLCESLGLDWAGDPEIGVGQGGPVQQNTGWLLLGPGAPDDLPDSREVVPGLRFAGSIESLRRIAEEPPEQVRLFLGYAGWGPGQLESELSQGAWLLVPTTAELVFDVEDERMWETAVRALGVDPATLVASPGIH